MSKKAAEKTVKYLENLGWFVDSPKAIKDVESAMGCADKNCLGDIVYHLYKLKWNIPNISAILELEEARKVYRKQFNLENNKKLEKLHVKE